MAINSRKPPLHRHSLRLKGYNYAQMGAYFITICTANRKSFLGKIVNGKMQINGYGKIIETEWLKTPHLRPNVSLDTYVIMPNHFHAILIIHDDVGATRRVAPTIRNRPTGPLSGSVGAIVGQFKSKVTKRINSWQQVVGKEVWQRNYYEHVIRDEDDLNRVREYIENNPDRWLEDEYYIN
jgi:putative transposase